MKLRIGSITFLLFLSSVAFPQATSRYLDKPLPQGWEEDTQIFQQVLPVDDQWWKAFQDPVLDSLISVAVKQNYSVLTAIDPKNGTWKFFPNNRVECRMDPPAKQWQHQ